MKAWLQGLATTAVSAIGTGIVTYMVDPKDFNFSSLAGWEHIGLAVLGRVVFDVGLYLSKSPLEFK